MADAIRAVDEPVDLVGHDWGALLTYRLATAHDISIRSWAADVANVMHRGYVWHDFAQIWQTPGKGEDYFRMLVEAGPEFAASGFASMGVPPTEGLRMARWMDQRMGQSVLDLYRSATPNHSPIGAKP